VSDLLVGLLGVRAGWKLQSHEEGDGCAIRHFNAVHAIDAVFPEDREASSIHVLDGGDIDPARIAVAPCLPCRFSQTRDKLQAAGSVRKRNERQAESRPAGKHAEGGCRDDPERSF